MLRRRSKAGGSERRWRAKRSDAEREKKTDGTNIEKNSPMKRCGPRRETGWKKRCGRRKENRRVLVVRWNKHREERSHEKIRPEKRNRMKERKREESGEKMWTEKRKRD
jgi:hypothetical protein